MVSICFVDRFHAEVLKHVGLPLNSNVIRIESMDDEITIIISEEGDVPIHKILEGSTLLGDLNIDGDNAWEIFLRCHDKYGLDLNSFDFHLYLRNEPCLKCLVYLYRKFKYRDEHVAAKKTPITVKQLIDACKKGKW